MLYPLIRTLLFSLEAERSHDAGLAAIAALGKTPALRKALGLGLPTCTTSLPVEIAGLKLPNPVGLAAGLDKHASATAGFLALGFGFVELGTVTPRPQDGNPKPRLFRLRNEQAIINRMGFNSVGFDAFRNNFVRQPVSNRAGMIGINIGKNAATPIEKAADDYLLGLEFAHGLGDYITVNVSSPNTQDLRALQSGDELSRLLDAVGEMRERLEGRDGTRQPVFIKIAPDDMSDSMLEHIVSSACATGIDGVINTNTTITRVGVEHSARAGEGGGLSGKPLTALSRDVNARLCAAARGRIDVISCGGIGSADEAWTRMLHGATAVQLYTSFIFHGPAVLDDTVRGLERIMRSLHSSTLADALAQARRNATTSTTAEPQPK